MYRATREEIKIKIAVVGIGYVGLATAVLLALNNEVIALDVVQAKVDMVNAGKSPIDDQEIEEFLATGKLNLQATMDKELAYRGADYVVIATPTDYDPDKNCFNTKSVDSVIEDVLTINPNGVMVIKSTVPLGFTSNVSARFNTDKVIFSPEFLREGQALHDCLYPSRIIIGEKSPRAREFANLLVQGARKEDVELLFTEATEAEAIKLFANSYLAMRISFFNELDTYAELKGLNAKEIITGVSLDPRIGDHYNNPSFGYGGYCLPKDTKQLQSNFAGIPNSIVGAIVEANDLRKDHVATMVLAKNPRVIGVHRLAMKTGSDNFRSAAVLDVIEKVRAKGIEVIIFEPTIDKGQFQGMEVVNDLSAFKTRSDVILANRIETNLLDVREKVYSRDLFARD